MQNYKPLYLWSLEDAIRNNEKELWRESYKENCDCARTIERAIRNRLEDERKGKSGAIIDRKLRRKIQEKNEALGIKQG